MAVRHSAEITIYDVSDAYSVTLTNEAASFKATSDTRLGTQATATTRPQAFRGTDALACSVAAADCVRSDAANVTVSVDSAGDNATWPLVTIAVGEDATSGGTVTIPVVIGSGADAVTVEKVFSYSIALRGSGGSSGVRNWLRDTVTYELWATDGQDVEDGVIAFAPQASADWNCIAYSRIPAADYFGHEWTLSFDYRSDDWPQGNPLAQTYDVQATQAIVSSNREYRCVVTAPNGTQATTSAKSIKLADGRITSQPTDQAAAAGVYFTFSVAASGNVTSYLWQNSRNGTTWSNVTWSGFNTDTLSYKMVSSLDGRMFRCVVTFSDGTSETSDVATVVLSSGQPVATISTQPVALGETATFACTVTGADAQDCTYQWQYRDDGGAWIACPSAAHVVIDDCSFYAAGDLAALQYSDIDEGVIVPTSDWQRGAITYVAGEDFGEILGDWGGIQFWQSDVCGFQLRHIKLERGNGATDWTVAPEDVDDSIATETGNVNSALEDYKDTTDATLNDHDEKLGDLDSSVSGLLTDSSRMSQWFHFDDTGMVIGATDASTGEISSYYTRHTNATQSFMYDDQELMSLNGDDGLTGPRVTVDEVHLRNWMWVARENGNLSLKYVGN